MLRLSLVTREDEGIVAPLQDAATRRHAAVINVLGSFSRRMEMTVRRIGQFPAAFVRKTQNRSFAIQRDGEKRTQG